MNEMTETEKQIRGIVDHAYRYAEDPGKTVEKLMEVFDLMATRESDDEPQ